MGGSPIARIEYKDFSRKVHDRAAHAHTVVNAEIELTYGCNLHCVHCYTDCYNRPDLIRREMSTGEVIRILDELRSPAGPVVPPRRARGTVMFRERRPLRVQGARGVDLLADVSVPLVVVALGALIEQVEGPSAAA